MAKKFLTLIVWFILPFQSCTNLSKMSDNQRKIGHFKLYTYPEPIKKIPYDNTRYTKIAVVATNNLNGMINPRTVDIPNRFKEERKLKIGGVSAIKTYKDLLKQHYNDSLLFLDAGSFLDESDDHIYTQFLRNYLEYDAGAIAPGEFQLIPKNVNSFQTYLKSISKKNNFPLLASNIFDLKTAEQIEWPNIYEQQIIEKSGLKIGLIGVITPESSKDIPDRQINGIYFQNTAKKVISISRSLKRKGAQIIILIGNGEFDCTSQLAQANEISEDKVNFVPFEYYHCDIKSNPFFNAMELLPPKTIDAVVSSGAHSKVVNFINNIPVIQNKGKSEYLSWLELTYDHKHNALDTTKTKIQQPIQLCHHFLKGTLDCFLEEDYSESELIPATFLGQKVVIKDLPPLNDK